MSGHSGHRAIFIYIALAAAKMTGQENQAGFNKHYSSGIDVDQIVLKIKNKHFKKNLRKSAHFSNIVNAANY